MAPSIRVRDLVLDIPVFTQPSRRVGGWLRTLFAAATSPPRREIRRLLDGISFELGDGDRLALLGRNGAGKTTLLRVLSSAYRPTTGVVEITGRKQALLNLGLGFAGDATVRENIFLRALTMSMPLSSVHVLSESILDFAELADRQNDRLSTLSSGQRMRLGFAISTCIQHEVMLLDEWFGAGDAGFVQKARGRMAERANGSRIVVLASHNFSMLRKVCNRGLVLEAGRVAFDGGVEDAIKAYKAIYQAEPEYKEQATQEQEEDSES